MVDGVSGHHKDPPVDEGVRRWGRKEAHFTQKSLLNNLDKKAGKEEREPVYHLTFQQQPEAGSLRGSDSAARMCCDCSDKLSDLSGDQK